MSNWFDRTEPRWAIIGANNPYLGELGIGRAERTAPALSTRKPELDNASGGKSIMSTDSHVPLFAISAPRWLVAALLFAGAAVLLLSCGSDDSIEATSPVTEESATAEQEPCPTINLSTHDSFVVSESVFETFTAETCIGVTQLASGDAGQLVSAAILTRDNPTADVMYGVDNTFLQRALNEDIFVEYQSANLATVPAELQFDTRVTPINFGDVCVNYWTDELPGDAPMSLDDLVEPANSGEFVTMNPETSSPGFAFLLATIARYGDDWEDYWQSLVDNDVAITSGWSDAYYGEFIAGGGDRSIVLSYASSPPADVLFAEEPIDAPRTAVLFDSCFRQIEFAGILAGTEHPEAAQKLVDFMLSPAFQEDIPLNMFVYPANANIELPQVFTDFGGLADNPLTIDPVTIEENRTVWTERWNAIVQG